MMTNSLTTRRPEGRVRIAVAGLAAAAALALAAPRADAGMIVSDNAASEENLGSFAGSITVSNNTSTSATITVVLTNTSPSANGGYITAFAFNNPGTAAGGNITDVVNFTATDPDGGGTGVPFDLLGGPSFSNSISATPFGSFDIGASLPGGSFNGGGGNPNKGIGVGETATYTFDVVGTNLLNLTQASLEAAITNGAGGRTSFFQVRFRGFVDGGSDKVPAMAAPVPEPGTVAMAFTGSIPLGLWALRRRKRHSS